MFVFVAFLYRKGFLDNYVGMQIKTTRTFLRYLIVHKGIGISEHYKTFYVIKEETPVVVISLEQLKFILLDKLFLDHLPEKLKLARDIFIFGCSVGLRISDLLSLKQAHLVCEQGNIYLIKRSIKSSTDTRIKLPDCCLEITNKDNQVTLFPIKTAISFCSLLASVAAASA